VNIEDVLDVGRQHPTNRHRGDTTGGSLCVLCLILAADEGSAWCRHCHPRQQLEANDWLDRIVNDAP
jgi:hypothetical protein